MAWYIRTMEIANEKGEGIGKYRLTATSDEDGGGPFGLCDHQHDSRTEAAACPEAQEHSNHY